ncbi:hypothetical protein [Filimonas effusa]|uniref:Uncharacterized protein n=1 Tax=Filimonas effusa TaxID=2508721 RepID=A0A4Q1D934_9BACT|nr:hypothetical protein [Filimonas effusa]RXK85730.1 hypothetical protein ESB13_02625 [Filimonas effusa]
MNLLPGEEVLVGLHGNKTILTSRRLQTLEKGWGSRSLAVVFLENISLIEVKKTHNVILLCLAVVGIAAGIIELNNSQSSLSMGILFTGIILMLFWWFSGRNIVKVSSKGIGTLSIDVVDISDAEVDSFIEDIQSAQENRLKPQLHAD